jgi:hypothetical protein
LLTFLFVWTGLKLQIYASWVTGITGVSHNTVPSPPPKKILKSHNNETKNNSCHQRAALTSVIATPTTSALWKLRQEAHKFQDILGYIARRPCLRKQNNHHQKKKK